MKIATIVGARPQFIKAAVVSRAISESNKLATSKSSLVNEVIIHTGQHYDRNMSDIFFEEMSIPTPDYFLDINGLSHGAMTGQMLEKIEEVLVEQKPDTVLVYGDTNTTLAGALAAAKLQIPVAHVESGLRSFNHQMPEEINRVVTDHISTILFCPTAVSVDNLKKEGINKEKTARVGDVMLDAVIYYKKFASKPSFDLSDKFVLATIHRAENTDNLNRLESIFNGFEMISKEIPIILPLHPRTRDITKPLDMIKKNSNLKIINPVSYLEMLYLLEKCTLVMTDSGGLQKEAFFFKRPCITLRDETEWVELVEHGFNFLAGTDTDKIYDLYRKILKENFDFSKEFYGDGNAGEKIIDILGNLNLA